MPIITLLSVAEDTVTMTDFEEGDGVAIDGTTYAVRSRCEDYGLFGCYNVKGPDCDRVMRCCKGPKPNPALDWDQDSRIVRPLGFFESAEKGYGYVFEEVFPGKNRSNLYRYTESPACRRNEDGSVDRIAFSSTSAKIRACLNVIELFRELDGKGIYLRRFSPEYLIFDLDSGDVVLDLYAMLSDSTYGTSYSYIHPSVLSRDDNIRKDPDATSNHFTLASVLFRIFCGSNPYEGAKVVLKDNPHPGYHEYRYVKKPIYVYDPDDDSNRPVRGIHSELIETWEILPTRIREEFGRAFSARSEGIPDLDAWTRTIVYMRTALTVCCKRAYYLDDSVEMTEFTCPKCGSSRPIMTVGPYRMVFGVEMELNPIHIDPSSLDYTHVVASVMESPNSPGVFGIKNGSDTEWLYWFEEDGADTVPDDSTRLYKAVPGKSAKPVSKGMVIDFGKGYRAHLI